MFEPYGAAPHGSLHLWGLPKLVVVAGFYVCEPHCAVSEQLGSVTMEGLSPLLALRPREAAKALGLSSRTLWQLTKDGHIPCVRIRGAKRVTVRYPVADLQAWLSSNANRKKGGENVPQ